MGADIVPEPGRGRDQGRELRVGDAEREHVGGLLQRALSLGRITIDEFDERMGVAMAAKTRGELNIVLIDLPGMALQRSTGRDVVELRAGVGELKRRGLWVVPATVRVSSVLGSVLLDFTEAELTGPVTTVELDLGVGEAKIVVPEGATVDSDDVRAGIGEVKDRTVKRREPAGRHFVVRGGTKVGEIKIMHPRAWRLGPVTVHIPFRLTWSTGP